MNRFLVGFVFIALYCFSIGSATPSFASHFEHGQHTIKKANHFVSLSSSNSHTIAVDNSYDNGSFFDGKVKDVSTVLPARPSNLVLAATNYNQYHKRWRNILIDSRKANQIYPFHTFW